MADPRSGDEVTLLSILSALLRQRRVLVIGTWGGMLLGALAGIVRKEYTAASSFRPEASAGSMSRFGALASQLGLAVPVLDADESLEFYEQLAKSREVLGQVVRTTYRFGVGPADGDSLTATLLQIYDVPGDTPDEQLRRGVDRATADVSVTSYRRAGLVELRTRATWPGLAEAINRRLLELINTFNLEKRQTRAAAERQFVEARMEQARSELEAAEAELRHFLERNRRYQDSPQLSFEAARLQRRVDLRQQVFVSLAQAYEQARVEEVRNTPVITVVDGPEGSARPSRGVIAGVAAGLVLGFLLSLTVALGREYLGASRVESPAEYAGLVALWQSAVGGMLPWGRRRGRNDPHT